MLENLQFSQEVLLSIDLLSLQLELHGKYLMEFLPYRQNRLHYHQVRFLLHLQCRPLGE